MLVQRYYQEEAVDYALASKDSPILCAPTGSGKTLILLWIAKWYIDRGLRVVILTPREEFLRQFLASADDILGPYQTGVEWNCLPAARPIRATPTITVGSMVE